jgi:hypothetical protein
MQSQIQFHYWYEVLSLELLMLSFVRSIRTGDFNHFLQTLPKLNAYFFAFNHSNYARWLSVHIRDMMTLESAHPAVYSQFVAGNFVVQKSRQKFSSIAIDHCHEQNNAIIKGGMNINFIKMPCIWKLFQILEELLGSPRTHLH